MYVVFTIILLWLIIVTAFTLSLNSHYRKLMKFSGKKGDMQEILEKLMQNLEKDKIDLSDIKNEIKLINKRDEVHIQKVGLIRYNPFPETGGDQSFVLALLDKNNNGILISSLHARTTTRWYAKTVVNGKGDNIDLSKEELKAIESASKFNKN